MVKIDDISKATGFSRTTISKALNDKSDISEKTKEIVRKAAKELNYIPNINARNLRKKRNNIIAVIISSPSKESEKTNSLYPLLLGVNKFLEEKD
jgi:DNA-binding LacI/PurR family transcriptional regulator